MARALKVYRTPIGFHDAYVAAPSQKAALEAWGADRNLFARGDAELVTDTKLTLAPLADPGKVIRVARGSEAEHLAAAGPKTAKKPAADEPPRAAPKRKPPPRPSRAKLDAAERAVDDLRAEQRAASEDLRDREEKLAAERRALEQRQAADLAKLDRVRNRAEAAYERALDEWRVL
jgi:hypothetical protein